MDLYTTISKKYDQLFQLDKQVLDLIIKNSSQRATILDVGCATGSLALALYKSGYIVTAVDYDTAMINAAKAKLESLIQSTGSNSLNTQIKPDFSVLDMRTIGEKFLSHSFNTVACLGNTLVHLENRADVAATLQGFYAVLKPASTLIVQILNYDYILDQQILSLPLIECDELSFSRSYEKRHDGRLNFNTRYRLHQTGSAQDQIFNNSVPLLPLRPHELQELLKQAGFSNITFYGDFNGGKVKENSLPLVVLAHT